MGANQRSPRRSSPEASEQAVLRIDGLTTTYGSIIAMRDVSLHVDGGEVVGLIGPNGAGKSTLLNTTVGSSGPRAAASRSRADVTGSTPDAMLWLGVALVPERRRLFADHGGGEPSRGRHHHIRHRPASAARRGRGAVPPARSTPVVPGRVPPGGEAQQLAIGRALMSGARLLLMDEPTSASRPRWWTWCSISTSTSARKGGPCSWSSRTPGGSSGWPIGRT